MKSLTPTSKLQRIPLNEISEGDNVRGVYADIEELAESIERHGQLQPIGVYKDDGAEPWRILYGHRRLRAHQLLVSQGKAEFASISAIVTERPANIEVVQLIENIHRDDLTDGDKEKAVRGLVDGGLSQREVSRMLNKSETWVSRCLSAGSLRLEIEQRGGSTENLSTEMVSTLSAVPAEKLAEVVEKVAQGKPTVAAVRSEVKAARAPSGLSTVAASNDRWAAIGDARPLGERIMYVCGQYREKASDMAANGAPELAKMVLEFVGKIEAEVGKK